MAFIESVEDTFDDVKKAVGDKGFLFIGLGAVALFIIVFLKQNSSSGQVTVATGITSYPDVVTNADVIIDSLQKSIAYSESEIREDIGLLSDGLADFRNENSDYYNSTQQLINDKANQTNEYMKEGFAKQEQLINQGFESVDNQLVYMYKGLDQSIERVQNGVNTVIKGQEKIQDKMASNQAQTMMGISASHLASSLQTEKAEMNIRNELKAGNETKL